MVDRMRTSVESDESSVDPDTNGDADYKIFRMKSDSSSIVSTLINMHMEDVTKVTSCIDLTETCKT